MSARESRRRRQLDQLRALCRDRAVGRAIDLAFEHFSCFGRDDDVVALLEASLDGVEADEALRRGVVELRRWEDGRPR